MSESKRLAFEIALAQLKSQKEDLRHARNQSAMAATVSGLVATVFASMVDFDRVKNGSDIFFLGIPLEFIFVLVTFSAAIYFSAQVSLSHRTCMFELSPKWILGQEVSGRSVSDLWEHLAKDCDGYFDQNEAVISEARFNLRFAMIFGFSQIPAWLLVLL